MHKKNLHPRNAGFSLIEMIVVIAIVTVLLAIALPAIARVRSSGKFAVSLSSHRQLMQTMGVYTESNRETHPYIVAGRLSALRPQFDLAVGPNRGLSMGQQARFWSNLMVDQNPGMIEILYPDIAHYPDFRERHSQNGIWQGAFTSTMTIFAAPGYFSPTRPLVDSQLRATRTSETRFPSAKMILIDMSSGYNNPQRVIDQSAQENSALIESYSFADGSAALIKIRDFNAPYVQRNFCSPIGPGYTTVDGLAGRDR